MTGETNSGANDLLADFVADLHRGRPRVWSVIITIFGDSLASRGGEIRLSVLQHVLDGLKIQSQATRAAMSRLAQDGWLVREKLGRESVYQLAGAGQNAFDHATRRIYRLGDPLWDGSCDILIATDRAEAKNRHSTLRRAGFAQIAPATYFRARLPGQSRLEALPTDLIFTSKSAGLALDVLTETLERQSKTDDLYVSFMKKWQLLQARDAEALTPFDALLMRTLLIHDWRRIVLRDIDLPKSIRWPDWPGGPARQRTADLYHALLPASEDWWNQCRGGANGPLPPADPNPDTRFRA